jgi:quercetin dioxygenase-like cupin family protein
MLKLISALLSLTLLVISPMTAHADPIDVTEIFSSSKTIEGQNFKYPRGTAEMRLVKAEFEKGATFPLHTHKTPLMGYIDQGELTLTKEDGSSQTFKTNESFILGPNTPAHTMGNTGDKNAVMWVAFASAEGIPNLNIVE